MIRENKFRISKRPYAVDLDSLQVETREPEGTREHRTHAVWINAAWFRRRRGETVACIGHLWDYLRDPAPGDAREALERLTDGRYGGRCLARWDGDSLWTDGMGWEQSKLALTHLEPMLESYPAAPPGYDGWWRF